MASFSDREFGLQARRFAHHRPEIPNTLSPTAKAVHSNVPRVTTIPSIKLDAKAVASSTQVQLTWRPSWTWPSAPSVQRRFWHDQRHLFSGALGRWHRS